MRGVNIAFSRDNTQCLINVCSHPGATDGFGVLSPVMQESIPCFLPPLSRYIFYALNNQYFGEFHFDF